MKTVSASEYKNQALKLMDEVHEQGETILVTKRGEPWMYLSPIQKRETPHRVFGAFRDECKIVGDIMNVIDPADWGDKI